MLLGVHLRTYRPTRCRWTPRICNPQPRACATATNREHRASLTEEGHLHLQRHQCHSHKLGDGPYLGKDLIIVDCRQSRFTLNKKERLVATLLHSFIFSLHYVRFMQLTTPSVPAMAVSTAIRIFRISLQSIFMILIYNLTVNKLRIH